MLNAFVYFDFLKQVQQWLSDATRGGVITGPRNRNRKKNTTNTTNTNTTTATNSSSSSSSFSSSAASGVSAAAIADQSEIVNVFVLRPAAAPFLDPSLPHVPSHHPYQSIPTLEDVICFAPPHGVVNDEEAYADCPSTLCEILGNRIVYPNPIERPKKRIKLTKNNNRTKSNNSNTNEELINYETSGKRTHTCNRCGKSFKNGHALGGHKKYCGKAEAASASASAAADCTTNEEEEVDDAYSASRHVGGVHRRWHAGKTETPSHQHSPTSITGNINHRFTVHATNRYEWYV